MELMRYIHLNPVRAKLVERPEQWAWSGHGEYTGKSERGLIDKGVVSDLFGEGATGYKKYIKYLEDGMAMGKRYEEDFHPSDGTPFLGSDDFKDKLTYKKSEAKNRKLKGIEEILHEVAKKTGLKEALIKSKSKARAIARARQEVIRSAVLDFELSQSDVARYLACSPSYITRVLQRIGN